MLQLRYLAGFWICFDFRIFQSSEYTRFLNMSGLHKVLNKIFCDRCLAVFWICFWFWICHGSKYAGATFSIIDIWQDSEYASSSENTQFCRKQPVIHVWQVSEYSLDSQSYRAWIYMVVNMPRLHMVLHKLYFKDSHYFECLELWIC